MDDQSSPLIKSTSGKGPYYRSEKSDKPSGTPAGSKNFKKILDSEGGGGNDNDSVETRQSKKGLDGELIAGNEQANAKASAARAPIVAKSPFTLIKGPENKTLTSRKSSTSQSPKQDVSSDDKELPEAALLSLEHADEDDTGSGIFDTESFFSEMTIADAKPAIPVEEGKAIAPPPPPPQTVQAVPLDNRQKVEVEAAKKDQVGLASLQQLKTPSEYSEAILERTKEAPQFANKDVSKHENFNNQFSREQPDLSSVNPLGIPTQQNLVSPAEVQTARPLTPANLQQLVEQLVKELTVVKDGDKTETSVVLSYPPQFDGVKVVITGYESSHNEFNLRFENLTQEAQTLVNQQQNRSELMSNLEKKGYNVHIFVASTYTETNPLTASIETHNPQRDRQNDRDEQERNRREREKQQG